MTARFGAPIRRSTRSRRVALPVAGPPGHPPNRAIHSPLFPATCRKELIG